MVKFHMISSKNSKLQTLVFQILRKLFYKFNLMKLYYENITEEEKISLDFPLDACVEQALEVFENLPQSDGSSFGLVDENDTVIHFEKFNKFMWLVQIPELSKHGSHQAICNLNQCKKLIKGLFNGVDPFDMIDFEFKSFL